LQNQSACLSLQVIQLSGCIVMGPGFAINTSRVQRKLIVSMGWEGQG
jgi:hypothetical protein